MCALNDKILFKCHGQKTLHTFRARHKTLSAVVTFIGDFKVKTFCRLPILKTGKGAVSVKDSLLWLFYFAWAAISMKQINWFGCRQGVV